MTFRVHIFAACALLALSSCQAKTDEEAVQDPPIAEANIDASQLDVAEAMIDAFYSFDPEQLRPLLVDAGDAADRLLFYQGWAEGGNYKIVNRGACEKIEDTKAKCPITVEDDAVLALKTDFKVTDTFTVTFDGSTIKDVETSSNDQPVYYQAAEWVRKKYPEIMDGPCQGFFAGGPTPGDCARAMVAGYREFADSDDFPG